MIKPSLSRPPKLSKLEIVKKSVPVKPVVGVYCNKASAALSWAWFPAEIVMVLPVVALRVTVAGVEVKESDPSSTLNVIEDRLVSASATLSSFSPLNTNTAFMALVKLVEAVALKLAPLI